MGVTMVKAPFAVWQTRLTMVALLGGLSASQLPAQTVTDSASGRARRQNAWVSLGMGASQLGSGGSVSGWYSSNRLVLGAQLAGGSEPVFADKDVAAASLQVGVRSMGRHGMALVAVGPARLWGTHVEPGGGFFGHRVDDPSELGAAAAAEATIHAGWIGIGLGLFAASAAHQRLTGATVSLQLGNLGA
jgi:hypothetical protein